MATAAFPPGLPDYPPSEEFFPEYLWEATRDLSKPQAFALLWAAAMQTVFERQRIHREAPGYRFSSYGALDPEHDGAMFGTVVHTANPEHMAGGMRTSLLVSDVEFPLVHRAQERYRPHRPPDPSLGTSACWAHSHRLSSSGPYALTAEHVVDAHKNGIGSRYPLAGGGHATVTDVASPGIDAALLDVGTAPVSAGLSTLTFPAPWTPVDVDGANGSVATTFMRSSDVTGSMHALLPIRLFLAHAGSGGDSGALVSDQAGTGMGLYMGEVTNQAGIHEGVCQHLEQVVQNLNVSLLR